jgi:hypothetical protein
MAIGRDNNALHATAATVEARFATALGLDGLRRDGAAAPVDDLINRAATRANVLALRATARAMRASATEGDLVLLAWKALAEQAAKAVDEIGQQLGCVQDAEDIPLDVIEAIGGAVARMSENCAAICAATTAAYPDMRPYPNLVREIRWQAGLSAVPPE